MEEKRLISTEIQSIFQKYANVIICKFKFWVRRPLWWHHELIEVQMRHEIIFPFHNLSTKQKILGVPIYSEELQWILYRHVFAHVLWIKITQIRACCQLWRTLIALLKGEQIIKMLGKMCQIRWQRKFGDSMLQNASTRERRARMRVCMIFLSNAPYGLKRMQKKIGMIWSILNFCARVNARKNAHAQFCARLLTWNWPDGYWS